MYGNGFLNRGFIDLREILHAVRPHLRRSSPILLGRIAPGMAEFRVLTGRHMVYMLLAEALVSISTAHAVTLTTLFFIFNNIKS